MAPRVLRVHKDPLVRRVRKALLANEVRLERMELRGHKVLRDLWAWKDLKVRKVLRGLLVRPVLRLELPVRRVLRELKDPPARLELRGLPVLRVLLERAVF
jgi:hypothetical protein